MGYDRTTSAASTLSRVTGFFGTIEQRTDQDRIPTATRAAGHHARGHLGQGLPDSRDRQQAASSRARLEFGLDLNGRVRSRSARHLHSVRPRRRRRVGDRQSVDRFARKRIDTGFFFQGESPLGAHFSASGGVRFDYVSNINGGGYFGDQSVSNGAVRRLRLDYRRPILEHDVRRADQPRVPRSDALRSLLRGPSGRGFITGNPELEPETSLQLDLGVPVTRRPEFRAAGYFYNYRIKNLIERYPTTPTDSFAFRNRGRGRDPGLRGGSAGEFRRRFSARGHRAGRPRRGARRRRESRRHFAGHARVQSPQGVLPSDFMAFGRIAVYADDDRPGPSEIVAPGHTNFDLGASWTPIAGSKSAVSSRTCWTRTTTPAPICALSPPQASTGS